MPIASTMAYVKQLLDGQMVPGSSNRTEAYVSPPDPEIRQGPPHIYVWSARGSNTRHAGPRGIPPANMQAQYVPNPNAGFRVLKHSLEIFLVWFNDSGDPQQDSTFPWVLDLVINALATSPGNIQIEDPGTGLTSTLVSLGKDMDWEYLPVRSVADMRYQRLDALITAPVEEWVQG